MKELKETDDIKKLADKRAPELTAINNEIHVKTYTKQAATIEELTKQEDTKVIESNNTNNNKLSEVIVNITNKTGVSTENIIVSVNNIKITFSLLSQKSLLTKKY